MCSPGHPRPPVVLHPAEWKYIPPGYHVIACAFGGAATPKSPVGVLYIPFLCPKAIRSVKRGEYLLQGASLSAQRRSVDRAWPHTSAFALAPFLSQGACSSNAAAEGEEEEEEATRTS